MSQRENDIIVQLDKLNHESVQNFLFDLDKSINTLRCWECTKAYNFDIRDIKTGMRSYLIQKVCRQLYGIKLSYSIKYSRHWSDLRRYGGIIEDSDFFKNKQQTTLSMIGAIRDTIK